MITDTGKLISILVFTKVQGGGVGCVCGWGNVYYKFYGIC